MVFALLAIGLFQAQVPSNPPVYTAEGVVNAASNTPGTFAPNTIVSLYGKSLSFATRGLAASDIRGGLLPTVLTGTGVRVLIGNIPAHIYFVSPEQVNLLVPSTHLSGRTEIQLIRDGLAGPKLPIVLADESPELFRFGAARYGIATRADGFVHTAEDPARPGGVVVLYGTGLGRTRFDPGYGMVAAFASPIVRLGEFEVTLNGARLDAAHVLYAGLTPGFGGLYQINLRLPETVDLDPEIRVGLGTRVSEAGVRIYVRPLPPAPAPDPAASPALPPRAAP